MAKITQHVPDIVEIIGKPVIKWTKTDVQFCKECYQDELAVLLYKLANHYLFITNMIDIIPREDLIQDLVLYCYNALDRFDDARASLTPFIYACMTNRHRMIYRREKKHLGLISLDDEYNAGENLQYHDIVCQEVEEHIQLWSRCNEDILKLIKGTILERFYINGELQRHIAKDLGVSQSYVSRIIQNELKKLKEKTNNMTDYIA